MEFARGWSGYLLRRSPAQGRAATGRGVAAGGLLLLIGLAMLPALVAPDLLPAARGQEVAPTAAPDPSAEPATPAPAEKPPVVAPDADQGQAPKLPHADYDPGKIMPAPPPWPRGQDLPILKRYDIDWTKADTLLTDVRDHVFDFEDAAVDHDAAALYYLLRVAAILPTDAFKPAPPEQEVRHEDLLAMPRSYRGVPVTVSGVVSKVSDFGIPRPEAVGLSKFWVVDLFQEIKGPIAPVFTVVLASDPGALAQGDRIRVKGYFFKIRDYDSPEHNWETRTTSVYTYQAPMIVGRDFQMMPRQIMGQGTSTKAGLLGAGILGLVVLAVMALLLIRRLRARQAELRRLAGHVEALTPEEEAKRVSFLEQIEKAAGMPADHLPNKPPKNP